MMKKIFFQMVILLSLVSTILYAQPADKGLQIGDRMPDISMGQYLDAPNKKMKISDFKGKLLIIDFWGIKCHVCISHMPKMDSLQKEFGSKIQFVYVTRDDEKKVKEVLMKAKVKKPDVPFFISDKQFNKLFPHLGDPLHVWITPKGMVYAITQDYNTNEKTITEFLNGENPIIPRRWDWGVNLDYPLMSDQNSGLIGHAESYSVWFKGFEDYYSGNGVWIQKEKGANRETSVRLMGLTVDGLFGVAYMRDIFQVPINYLGLWKNNRLVLEVKDSSQFIWPKEDAKLNSFLHNNIYYYELKLSKNSPESIFDILKHDLSLKLPNYYATIENRKVKCIVLSDLSITDQEKAKSTDTTLGSNFIIKDSSTNLQNLPVNSFIAYLISNYSYLDTPFISETAFSGNLQMKLNAKVHSIEAFNKELNKYGFKISIEDREIKMLVIRDRKNEIAAH